VYHHIHYSLAKHDLAEVPKERNSKNESLPPFTGAALMVEYCQPYNRPVFLSPYQTM